MYYYFLLFDTNRVLLYIYYFVIVKLVENTHYMNNVIKTERKKKIAYSNVYSIEKKQKLKSAILGVVIYKL